MPDLLIELFSEEIPARMQSRASQDLQRLVTEGLVAAGLTYEGAGAFATPRRLTLTVQNLSSEAKGTREERKGPRTNAADKAIEGFLRSTGLEREALEVRSDKKGEFFFAVIETSARPASAIIAEVLENTIRNFPWPKSMRWGDGNLRWVRPLRSILCLLSDESGAEIIPLDVDGIAASDTTEGHRFMAPGRFSVTGFEDYAAKLKRAYVVLDAQERSDMIWADASNQAFAQGLELVADAALLKEVSGLVAWPVVLMGSIGAEFLSLPPEVLQTSMREHQKFFSVRNPEGQIVKYVTVANRETADQGATILAGNGKVLTARLSDAKFFWENDLNVAKAGMSEWLSKLSSVTFHAKLGSVADRIDRMALLAEAFAPFVGADAEEAMAAARIAKADLASEMVYEFPELQGVMGRYYAQQAGLSEAAAAVCAEHYAPLGPSDDVPCAPLSIAVALAEKIDVLTGFWAIDEKPTGSKDPFALRRAALGVIRIILENDINLPLEQFVAQGNPKADVTDLMQFFADRLKVYLRAEGLRHDVIDACFALGGQDDLVVLVSSVRALQDFLDTEDGENLLQGYKRANNILTQAEAKDGVEYSFGPDAALAESETEAALFAALDVAEAALEKALQNKDFPAAMGEIAVLRAPIDAFFTEVVVNADNQILRRNRLNLLHRIRSVMHQIAVLDRVEG